ncbi:MAG TPA: STAS domain-containing protein [bacterium]|nr:STAS domain-containing protein [bacterium]
MELKKSTQGSATVVAVTGRLDASTSTEMEKFVVGLIDAGERKLVLDFTGLEYTSSAGLRVLLVVTKKMKALQGKFLLAALNERIREVVEIAGFTAILQIHPTVEAAVQAIG